MVKRISSAEHKRKKRSFGAKLIWVANNLSEEKLKHADSIAPTSAQIVEFLMEAVDNGIDIKVSYDTFSDCYQATAIGGWEGADSSGYAVSARSGRDVGDALNLIWYKVVHMADFDLSALFTDDEEDKMRG